MRKLADGLWVIDFPGHDAGGLKLGLRSTVARVDSGLVVFSPGPFTPEHLRALRDHGPVVALVAPNKIHHLYLDGAQQVFLDARTFGAPGLLEKLRKQKRGTRIDEELSNTAPPVWSRELDQHLTGGMPDVRETVFLHRASRTLILTDLAFNVQRGSAFTRVVMTLNRGWKRFGSTRLAAFLTRDKTALRSSLERILLWDFDRVIVAHGDVLESGGRAAFQEGFPVLRTP